MEVKFVKLRPTAKAPTYATEGSAAADVYAAEEATLYQGRPEVVKTGISVEVPPGFEIQVRPRSGLALKHGVTVINPPGTIDSDYRGELGVILINHGRSVYEVGVGDRIAQLVIAPVLKASFKEVSELSDTSRGSGGYGSTGV